MDPQVKHQLSMKRKEDDGIFFMQFEDFLSQFSDIQVCMCYDSFKYQSLPVVSTNKNSVVVKIVVKTKGKYFFTVNQNSKRGYPVEVQSTFQYNYVTLVLAKKNEEGKFQFVEDSQGQFREVWTSKGENSDLAPGVYYLLCKVQWNIQNRDEFVLSSYGADSVDMAVTTEVSNDTLLRETYLDYAMTQSKLVKSIEGCPGVSYCVDRTDDGGYYYMAAWNRGVMAFSIKLVAVEMSDNMKFKSPFSGNEAQLMVAPGESKIALIRIKQNSFKFRYQLLTGFSEV